MGLRDEVVRMLDEAMETNPLVVAVKLGEGGELVPGLLGTCRARAGTIASASLAPAPRLSTLTPAEQDLLLSTAACEYPPITVSNLNEASDKSPKNVNVLLGRLVDNGVLYRIRKGQYDYTAPKFRDYLQRRVEPPPSPPLRRLSTEEDPNQQRFPFG